MHGNILGWHSAIIGIPQSFRRDGANRTYTWAIANGTQTEKTTAVCGNSFASRGRNSWIGGLSAKAISENRGRNRAPMQQGWGLDRPGVHGLHPQAGFEDDPRTTPTREISTETELHVDASAVVVGTPSRVRTVKPWPADSRSPMASGHGSEASQPRPLR